MLTLISLLFSELHISLSGRRSEQPSENPIILALVGFAAESYSGIQKLDYHR